jgi:hypothetical protein
LRVETEPFVRRRNVDGVIGVLEMFTGKRQHSNEFNERRILLTLRSCVTNLPHRLRNCSPFSFIEFISKSRTAPSSVS